MRDIKFRARGAEHRGYVYGHYAIMDGLSYIINKEGMFKVIADSIEQYTGLKDKNGVEIYEGDIIKYSFIGERIYEVKWIDKSHEFQLHDKDMSNCMEIVGNIYEDKELLKEKK